MSLRIVVSDHLPESGWEILHTAPGVRTSGPFSSRQQLLDSIDGADALIIRSATRVDADLLGVAPGLRVVARAGARVDNIDLEETTRRGILVINVPDANIYAAAEHTFALILALARQLPEAISAVRAGRWPRHEMIGFQLHGKSLGVIGFGRLGRAVAERAQAFGMHVLVYDPYIDLSLAREHAVEAVELDQLLSRADIVTPQTTLTARTRSILNEEAFQRIKPGAYLVNTVHAGLIDEVAMLRALDSGRLAGAALDTFEQEPPAENHALIRHPKVLPVPHLNQNTRESQAITGSRVVWDVLDALKGRDYRNVVNLPFNEKISYPEARPYIQLAARLGKLQGQLAEGWITRLEVELSGRGLRDLVRPVAAVLLAGMLRPVKGQVVNWVSAPMLAHEQGISTAQVKNLIDRSEYPNLLACRVEWQGGRRTVGGVLFANGDARLVHYDGFHVDAHPKGYVLVLENEDVPGVIGKVGTRLGDAGINIANWRYGRDIQGGRAVSFINLDSRVPRAILAELAAEPEIGSARLVRL